MSSKRVDWTDERHRRIIEESGDLYKTSSSIFYSIRGRKPA